MLGAKGALTIDNQRETSLEIATSTGYARAPLLEFFMERYAEAYAIEIAAFVSCVRDGKTPSPDGMDGLKALLIADAATQSMQEGRTVAI